MNPSHANTPLAIIVMGVSGCGKSVVGAKVAELLAWRFVDADDFHPRANVDKMRAGIALTDQDRWPWLAALNAHIRDRVQAGESVVLACSALRAAYRHVLATDVPRVRWVHLVGSKDVIAERLALRHHRYMPASLLESQFATLEAPADALTLDITASVDELAERIVSDVRSS